MNLIVFELRKDIDHVVPRHYDGGSHSADGGANRPPHSRSLVVNCLEPLLERRMEVPANHTMNPHVSVEPGSEVKSASEKTLGELDAEDVG